MEVGRLKKVKRQQGARTDTSNQLFLNGNQGQMHGPGKLRKSTTRSTRKPVICSISLIFVTDFLIASRANLTRSTP
jgi:hypothetical protein